MNSANTIYGTDSIITGDVTVSTDASSWIDVLGTSTYTTSSSSLDASDGVSALYADEISFSIDGEPVTFKGREITRLKEMLTTYIKDNHPEDLL